ncbi:hypothetical protein [Rhizobium sp. BK176]|uniref:hypothetical protein n=1 Tax=Rhizobium sp. BK176 TaxID=2587071 RepID=UPI0021670098|nr:hypothetical protein [Rhizobium sp. BK176]MCS4088861.1 hypothetical protein [Rhizobium sp. BK176]
MRIEPDSILETLGEIELERTEIALKLSMYGGHIAHLRRPDDVQGADRERQVIAMYERVGVIMPGAIKQRFDDVRAFHASISANRKIHLADQVDDYLERMAECEQRLKVLKARKNELLAVLSNDTEGRPADVAAAEARLVELPGN